MFFVLTRYKTVLKTLLLQSSFSIIWEAGFQASPQFDSNKIPFYSSYCLLIIL